jgi:hypothetical protein
MSDEEKSTDPFISLLSADDTVLDEAALLDLFTARVEELMRDNLDLLLSSLYRLDIYEEKIEKALHSPDVPAARGIAALIIERQKEKISTRKKYNSGNPDMWKGLE